MSAAPTSKSKPARAYASPLSLFKAIFTGLRSRLPDIESPLSLKSAAEKTAFNGQLKALGVDYNKLALGVDESGSVQMALVERHLGLIGQAGTGKSVAGAFLCYQFAALGGAVIVLDAVCDRDLKTRLQSMLADQGVSFRDAQGVTGADYFSPGLTYWAPESVSWGETVGAVKEAFESFSRELKSKAGPGALTTPALVYIAEAGSLISAIGAKAFAVLLREARHLNLRVVYDLQSCVFPSKGAPDEIEGCDLLLTYTGSFALFKMHGSEREITRLSELARKPLRQEVAWLEVGQTLLVRPWEGSSPVPVRVPYLET